MKPFPGVFCRRLFLGFVLLSAAGGCTLLHSNAPSQSAFIQYWPAPEGSTKLKLAVKDNIDMQGVVTSAGSEYLSRNNPPAKADAPCLAIARQRGVHIVGKTNLSEFAIAPSGINEYFGTPRNPYSGWLQKFIPGGSSCGAAVAITTGLADVAFGTDTAGSVRVPAACCGIVGLKTTQGLIPLDGIHPIDAEHLDTVGPLGRTVEYVAQGMDLLQSGFARQYLAAQLAKPTAAQIRLGRLYLKGTDPRIDKAIDAALAERGFQVTPLGDDFRAKWEQAHADGDVLAAVGAWRSDRKFLPDIGVSSRTKTIILYGGSFTDARYREALARREAWQQALAGVFRKVDFIAVPTLQSPPPLIPALLKIDILEAQMLTLQNTVAVNYAGNPALAVPVFGKHASTPRTSVQFVGPRLSEAALLNAGRLLEADYLP